MNIIKMKQLKVFCAFEHVSNKYITQIHAYSSDKGALTSWSL